MNAPRLLVDGLAFGEGPRWHDGALHLSDMHAHRVIRVEADGTTTTVLQHDAPVSGIGWLPDGRLQTVAMDGFILRDGEVAADVRALAPFGINDMVVHPEGWAYVGQFGYDRDAPGRPEIRSSALLRVDLDGSVHEAAPDLLVANGMAITPDGSTLVVAESAGRRLSSFAIGAGGTLTDRQVYAELPDGGAPDGMCIDAEGAWVAAVTLGQFIRLLPGGEVTDRVPVADGRHAIACVLGGPDRRTLFMITATTFGEADASRAALAGRVDAIDVEIPGVGWP